MQKVESFVGLAEALSHELPPKPPSNDSLGRFREIISDPINALIDRHPWAGQLLYNDVVLHNGVIVPSSGALSYYDTFSHILVINRGVHEPLEEYCFQEMLKCLPPAPVMLELGAYWGHYSMWCQKMRPEAKLFLVEPEMANLECAINNFKRNGFSGTMLNELVSPGQFEVDKFMAARQLDHLHVLHSDIQGSEVQMLMDAKRSLAAQKIDYVFVSTHSDELHHTCIYQLNSHGYDVTIESNYSAETTSEDGFILAVSPQVDPLLKGFKFHKRPTILRSEAKTS